MFLVPMLEGTCILTQLLHPALFLFTGCSAPTVHRSGAGHFCSGPVVFVAPRRPALFHPMAQGVISAPMLGCLWRCLQDMLVLCLLSPFLSGVGVCYAVRVALHGNMRCQLDFLFRGWLRSHFLALHVGHASHSCAPAGWPLVAFSQDIVILYLLLLLLTGLGVCYAACVCLL